MAPEIGLVVGANYSARIGLLNVPFLVRALKLRKHALKEATGGGRIGSFLSARLLY